MEHIDDKFCLFDLYPKLDSFLDCKIISVHSSYRGCGVAGKLMNSTMQYIRDNNLNLIQVLCTSHYSARVCEKMSFKRVYELAFDDYKVNGENPIVPEAPHKEVVVLVQEVK